MVSTGIVKTGPGLGSASSSFLSKTCTIISSAVLVLPSSVLASVTQPGPISSSGVEYLDGLSNGQWEELYDNANATATVQFAGADVSQNYPFNSSVQWGVDLHITANYTFPSTADAYLANKSLPVVTFKVTPPLEILAPEGSPGVATPAQYYYGGNNGNTQRLTNSTGSWATVNSNTDESGKNSSDDMVLRGSQYAHASWKMCVSWNAYRAKTEEMARTSNGDCGALLGRSRWTRYQKVLAQQDANDCTQLFGVDIGELPGYDFMWSTAGDMELNSANFTKYPAFGLSTGEQEQGDYNKLGRIVYMVAAYWGRNKTMDNSTTGYSELATKVSVVCMHANQAVGRSALPNDASGMSSMIGWLGLVGVWASAWGLGL